MSSTRRPTARALVAALGALLSVGPLAAQGNAPQGWSFVWTVSSTVRGQPSPAAGMTFDVAVWHGTARITPRPGQAALRAMFGEGSVILARDRDSVLTVVLPAKREALAATAAELAMMGSGGAGAVQITISDVASTTRRAGTAPPLEELTARRVTLEQRYRMAVRVQEMQRAVQVAEQTTLDLSDALDARDAGFRAFATQFLRGLGKPREVVAALQQAAGRLPPGVPLRTRVVTSTVAGTDTLRAESVGVMSALQRVAVDTLTFRVPAGFRVTEVRRLLQPRGVK